MRQLSKKLNAPYKSAIKGVAENQKSECARCNAGAGWDFLTT
jgi:hypothetical protein